MKALVSVTAAAVLAAGLTAASAQAGVWRVDRALFNERNVVRAELRQLFSSAADGIISEAEYDRLVTSTQEAAQVAQRLRNLGFGRGFGRRYEQRSAEMLASIQQKSAGHIVVVADEDDAAEAQQMMEDAESMELATEFLNSGQNLRRFKRAQRISWDDANRVAHFAGLKLMAGGVTCEYSRGMTRIRANGYSASAFLPGNRTADCSRSDYDASNLLMTALR